MADIKSHFNEGLSFRHLGNPCECFTTYHVLPPQYVVPIEIPQTTVFIPLFDGLEDNLSEKPLSELHNKEGIGDLLRGKIRKSSGDERTPMNNKGGLEIEPKEAINGDNMDNIT
ncbi:hypothetical protein AgCh_016336 [Apium graveolens]